MVLWWCWVLFWLVWVGLWCGVFCRCLVCVVWWLLVFGWVVGGYWMFCLLICNCVCRVCFRLCVFCVWVDGCGGRWWWIVFGVIFWIWFLFFGCWWSLCWNLFCCWLLCWVFCLCWCWVVLCGCVENVDDSGWWWVVGSSRWLMVCRWLLYGWGGLMICCGCWVVWCWDCWVVVWCFGWICGWWWWGLCGVWCVWRVVCWVCFWVCWFGGLMWVGIGWLYWWFFGNCLFLWLCEMFVSLLNWNWCLWGYVLLFGF